MKARISILGWLVFPLLLAGCARAASTTAVLSQSPTPIVAIAPTPTLAACNAATEWRPLAGNVQLNDLTMVAPDEGWIVGNTTTLPGLGQQSDGVIYHLVQGQWVRLPQVYPGAPLLSLSMDSPTDGWAASNSALTGAGDQVLVLHYSLGQWHPVDIPALDAVLKGPPGTYGGNIDSISVQMFGPNAGWMFAETNIPRDLSNQQSRSEVVILRYQYGVWTPIAAPAVPLTTELPVLSAVSADEAWIVGGNYGSNNLSTLFAHYVDGAWSLWPKTFPGVTENFTMLSPSDGWAFDIGGGASLLLHYDGERWAPVTIPANWARQGVELADTVFPISSGLTWLGAYSNTGAVLEGYTHGQWQQVAWPYADFDPTSIGVGSGTELWGIGNIGHQEGCPPMNTILIEQGVLLHFQQGHWSEQILP